MQPISYSVICNKETIQGSGHISECPREVAMTRALVAWGILWLIMIPTIFIPLVHFVSVPALLLAGPIVARMIFKMYNGKTDVKISGVTCPNCQENIFLPGSMENWPVNNVCLNCKTSYSATIIE